MGKNRSTAVMEQRAPAAVIADDPIRARWRALDWYATPPWASRAGAELVFELDPDAKVIWEPACGDGIMVECLKEYFTGGWAVVASDIEPQGKYQAWDFLAPATNNPAREYPDWIITNPPFPKAEDFVRHGLEIATRGVAVLCRLAFLESSGRYDLHAAGPHRLTVLAPFSERVDMQLGPWNPECNTASAYAWFVYDKRVAGDTTLRIIPPGTEARLSKPDDVRRFVKPAPAPLLAWGGAG